MDDGLDVPSSARQGLLTVAVLVGVCVVLVAATAVVHADGQRARFAEILTTIVEHLDPQASA